MGEPDDSFDWLGGWVGHGLDRLNARLKHLWWFFYWVAVIDGARVLWRLLR